MVNRINKACKYYPCHKKEELQDCTYCYCYLFPCEDPSRGKYLKNGWWDCHTCTYPHNKERVDKIMNFLKENYKDDDLS